MDRDVRRRHPRADALHSLLQREGAPINVSSLYRSLKQHASAFLLDCVEPDWLWALVVYACQRLCALPTECYAQQVIHAAHMRSSPGHLEALTHMAGDLVARGRLSAALLFFVPPVLWRRTGVAIPGQGGSLAIPPLTKGTSTQRVQQVLTAVIKAVRDNRIINPISMGRSLSAM